MRLLRPSGGVMMRRNEGVGGRRLSDNVIIRQESTRDITLRDNLSV